MASLIRCLKDASVIPGIINIEHLEEIIIKMIPP